MCDYRKTMGQHLYFSVSKKEANTAKAEMLHSVCEQKATGGVPTESTIIP